MSILGSEPGSKLAGTLSTRTAQGKACHEKDSMKNVLANTFLLQSQDKGVFLRTVR